ncbi:MAG: LON peptidase substrate-binding domain-containing protein [Ardenticatenia bacterium]|nr:LON peptidase substrate-binding domain-containing protein [Ardenticatenia bacterium]
MTEFDDLFEFDELLDNEPNGVPETYEAIVIPLRDTVIFPRMMAPLLVGRDHSLRAVEAALEHDAPLIAVAQRDHRVERPAPDELFTVGTEVVVGRTLRMPDGTMNVLVQGRRRVRVLEFTQEHPYLCARVESVPERTEITKTGEALMRAVLTLFEQCVQLSRSLPEDAYIAALNADEPGWLADLIVSIVDFPPRQTPGTPGNLRPVGPTPQTEHHVGQRAGNLGAGRAHSHPSARGSGPHPTGILPP